MMHKEEKFVWDNEHPYLPLVRRTYESSIMFTTGISYSAKAAVL
jgi:hypothetical protein